MLELPGFMYLQPRDVKQRGIYEADFNTFLSIESLHNIIITFYIISTF